MSKILSQTTLRYAALGACAVMTVFSVKAFSQRPNPADAELALQAGFLQTAPVTVEPLADVDEAPEPDRVALAETPSHSDRPPAPEVQRAEINPALEPLGLPARASTVAPIREATAAQDALVSCTPDFKVSAVPGGLAYIALSAPCSLGQAVALSHGPLAIDITIPDAGRYAATLPVLDSAEGFRARFADGRVAHASLPKPSAAAFDHVVLQWRGAAGLQLHALEFGAGYGEAGHIWAGNPRETLRAVRGEGGFLNRLGDTAAGGMADVYSFPVGQMARPGQVDITVEAEVTAENCDSDIAAQLLQRGADGSIAVAEITFAVPACDAVGDILVLKNLMRDLKIAAK